MFSSLINSAIDTAVEVASDPIGATVKIATQPLRDGADLLDGLSEGEFRSKAALRLGADVVASLSLSSLLELMKDE